MVDAIKLPKGAILKEDVLYYIVVNAMKPPKWTILNKLGHKILVPNNRNATQTHYLNFTTTTQVTNTRVIQLKHTDKKCFSSGTALPF